MENIIQTLPKSGAPRPALTVQFALPNRAAQTFRFTKAFRIGRVEDCDVCIPDEHVSRNHVLVEPQSRGWCFRDMESSNGIFIGKERVTSRLIDSPVTLRLGVFGPEVHLQVDQPAASAASYVERYLSDNPMEGAGEHTMLVRRAFAEVKKKQSGKYKLIIGALVLLTLSGAGLALYEHQRSGQQRETAEALFYSMKSLDLQIDKLRGDIAASGSTRGQAEVSEFARQRKTMQVNYDQYLAAMHVSDRVLTPQRKLILRVARIFGECELTMPPDFTSEVENYIEKWRSSNRLENGIRTANQKGYTAKIAKTLLDRDLPTQFFYLALQESNFDPYNSGPPTRMGIAKGMWQFIPDTGRKYGLHIGPLAEFGRPDPGDDRHHWELETDAAARYLRDLYNMDGQGSGLLVAACYNWGEKQVLPLVRSISMPENPRDRNFWRLITLHRDKIPPETYNYVFYIASAAVIGEDPRLFGFNFDNPLANLKTK